MMETSRLKVPIWAQILIMFGNVMRIPTVIGLLVVILAANSPIVFADYSYDRSSTTNGDSYNNGDETQRLWGAILRLSVDSLNGNMITFKISKKDGGKFTSSGKMYLKVGAYQSYGANREDSRGRGDQNVYANTTRALYHTHDLSKPEYHSQPYPKDFYAHYETEGGQIAWVGPIKVSYEAVPDDPRSPNVTAKSSNKIDVSWDSVSGASKYSLSRATSSRGSYSRVYCGSSRSYSDSSVSPDTRYYYKVKAGTSSASCSGSSGWSDFSSYDSDRTPEAIPEIPYRPYVSVMSHNRIDISWNTVSGASKYSLWRSTSSYGSYQPIKCDLLGTSYKDYGVSPQTTYYYKLKAGNGSASNSCGSSTTGWSYFSSDRSGTTPPVPDYDSPILTISSHSNGARVTVSSITLSGSATDSGRGNNGISQVAVNGSRVTNDTASGSGSAYWRKTYQLREGTNQITIIAYDNSANRNKAETTLTIHYDKPTPIMAVTPTTQNFGSVEIGKQSSPKTFTILNTGNADLVVQSIVSSSSEFKVQGSCGTISANGSSSGGSKGGTGGSNSCTFSAVFTPNGKGTRSSVLTIRSSDGQTKTIRLTGTGIEPPKANISVNTTTLSFGDVETGQSPSKSFNISNTGNADLKVNPIAGGNGFSATHNCGMVKSNASCSVTVTFKPTQAQPHSYTLNITSNASNGTQRVTVSGTGIEPPKAIISVNTTTLSFGDVETGQSPSKSFNISNTGNADLKVNPVAGGNGFSATHNCGIVKTNRSCQVTVIFKPTQAQPHSYTLNITSNASNGTQRVTVSGNGKGQAQLSIAPNPAQDFGEIKVDESSSPKTFTIRNNGNVAASIKDIKSTNEGEFKVKDDGCTNTTVSAGGTCTFNIVFEPNKGGPTQSRLIVTHDTGSLPEVQLKGSGKVLDKMIRLKVVNPESLSNVKPGESFDITLQFVPDDEKPADGIQTYIEFDPTKLKVNSVKNSGVLDFTLLEHFDNSEGYVSFAAMSWENSVPTEEFNLVTINFTALEGASDGEIIELTFDSEKNYFSSTGEFISMDYAPIPITFVTKKPVIAIEPLPFPAFGEVEKESRSEPKTLIIRNNGEADLQLEAIPENVEGFKLVHNCSEPIKPTQKCDITITFTPSEARDYKESLTIASNASNEVPDVVLEGKGIEPPAVLKGKVTWQGHVSEPYPEWNTGLEVTIDGLAYYPPPQEVGNSGEFELPELADGEHSIEVKGLHTLSTFKKFTLPLPEGMEVIEFGEPPLLEGDVEHGENGNHKNLLHSFKDGTKLVQMTVGYPEKKVCIADNPEGYNPQGDLNADGCVSKADGELIKANLLDYFNEHGYVPPEGLAGKTCQVKKTNRGHRAGKRNLRDGQRYPEGMASFSTTNIPTNLSVGDTFEMTVMVNANVSEPIDAVAVYLNFAPDLLEVKALKSFNRFDLVMEDVFSNGLGRVDFVAFIWDEEPIVETTQLMTISFTLLGEGGEKTIAFNGSEPQERATKVLSNNYEDTLVIKQAEVVFEDDNAGNTGTVSGNLRDAFGNPIANARVIIGDLEATSDEQGHYEITGVPAGSHPVIVESDGQNFQSQTITVSGEDNAPIRLDLVSDWDKTWNCPIYALQDHKRSDTQPFMIDPITGTVYADENLVYLNADIEGLSLHPVTGELYCSSGDMTDKPGYLCKINRHTGELTYIGATGFKEVDSLAFHPDGSLWGWAVREGLITIDSETGQGTLFVPYDKEFVEDMVWSHDGQLLYATQDHNLWAYDGQILHLVCDNLPNQVEAIEMLPGEVLLFAFDGDNHIRFWDIKRCTEIWEDEDFEMPSNFNDIEGISSPSTCQPQ